MSDTPWLTIVGLGEDALDGLPPASRQALADAKFIMGAARHVALLPDLDAEIIIWPVPFSEGIAQLLDLRGEPVVMLASGDPFWHGAGAVLARHIPPSEWRALPAPSCMSLAAASLGWPLETTLTFGLHAARFSQLKPHLFPKSRIIITLRDGDAVAQCADWLVSEGFGASDLHVLEALGGPRERIRHIMAADMLSDMALTDIQHPVVLAIEVAGDGTVIPLASGRPDDIFENDGQITKRPIRALTLSALAPRPHEYLWDIGGGSGSIGLEWLWAHPTMRATSVEIDATRAERIRDNARRLGLERLNVVTGDAPDALTWLDTPDAVFIGGGISQQMLDTVWDRLPDRGRLVANGVTLEAEVLLAEWHAEKGGSLMRIELAQSKPLGRKRGWKSSYPIVQWSVTK